MTKTLFDLFLLCLFLLSMTTVAALRSLAMLSATNSLLIFCVPMLGAATFTVLGYTTGVGNIFFAAMMYGISLKRLLYGANEASKSVANMLFTLLIAFGSIFLLEQAQLLSPMFGTRIRIFGASFVAFWLAQSLYILLLDQCTKNRSIWSIVIVAILIQGLISAVFFPCAFAGDIPFRLVVEFGVVGWITKSTVVVISIPFLAFFFWIARDRVGEAG